MKYKVYQKIAQCVDARLTCIKRENTAWIAKHEETIEEMIKEYMPHGSGIDGKTTIDYDKSKSDKLVFNSSFHAMNENGFYEGWIDYILSVSPSLIHGFILSIVGQFGQRQDIKDYLYDIYRDALQQEI
jgi:hypothetical protein